MEEPNILSTKYRGIYTINKGWQCSCEGLILSSELSACIGKRLEIRSARWLNKHLSVHYRYLLYLTTPLTSFAQYYDRFTDTRTTLKDVLSNYPERSEKINKIIKEFDRSLSATTDFKSWNWKDEFFNISVTIFKTTY